MQTRHEMTAANIGEKAYPRFRHGEERRIAGDTKISVDGYTDAAAHDDAVNHRHIRL